MIEVAACVSSLLSVKDKLECTFYEAMAIRGTWSVRELQRQKDANYYERSGWSEEPEKLAQLVEEKADVESRGQMGTDGDS